MRRSVIHIAMWLLVSVAPIRAQNVGSTPADKAPETEKETAPLPEVEIPERKIKFVRAEEPYKMTLFRADPKCSEQHVVAEIVVAYAGQAEQMMGEPNPLVDLHLSTNVDHLLWYPSHDFSQSLIFDSVRKSTPYHHNDYFAQISDRLPDSHGDRERPVSFFDQAAADRYLRFDPSFSFPVGTRIQRIDQQPYFAFRLLAPTAERAEELSGELLRLFDYGLSRPSMIEALRLIEEAEQLLAKRVLRSRESEKKLPDLKKQLESSAQVSSHDLVSLKTQRHLAEVDLAGVQARIEAAAKALARDDLPPRLFEPVETIKITAQIELASLAARKKTLGEIIRQGTARKQLESELIDEQASLTECQKWIRIYQSRIKEHQLTYKLVGPLRLHNNEVILRRIVWLQPKGK